MSVTTTRPGVLPAPATVRWLALGAVAGPILATLAWVVLGLLRPGYSPIRQQISDLAIGSNGVLMGAAFVLSGVLCVAGVAGVFRAMLGDVGTAARWVCAALLALAPLGVVGVGIFNERQVAGHVAAAILAFQTPVIGFLVTGLVIRRSPYWRRIGNWLLLASPLTLALVFVFLQTGPPGAPLGRLNVGGLTERVMVVEIYVVWYAIMGWTASRRS